MSDFFLGIDIGKGEDETAISIVTLKARDADPSEGWDDDPLDMTEGPRQPLKLSWHHSQAGPNLQNIPIRTPEGARIRDLFRGWP